MLLWCVCVCVCVCVPRVRALAQIDEAVELVRCSAVVIVTLRRVRRAVLRAVRRCRSE
jgi:hypothetical protein